MTTTTPLSQLPSTDAPERPDAPVHAAGVLDLVKNGHGILRTGNGLPTPEDVQLSATLIRQHGLRRGDLVVGTCQHRRTLTAVEHVNGLPVRDLRSRPHFRDVTPVHPHSRLRLDSPAGGLTTRVMDLFTPVGKGQRGLIVAPPKTGKTMLLQQVAASVARNHPECHLMVLLLDERPEEVTDMRRTVRGELLASTFDRTAKEHTALAELAVERAKRLVEQGQDVVLLMDSLTRLCRAHNNSAPAGGKTLTGGVDVAALHGPKKFFGAARQAEEGGSLTILATALVETGSRADDYYFEELKSTGNMELRLDRSLAGKRVFPAIDLNASSTRRDELLAPETELTAVRALRRALDSHNGESGTEALLERMRRTPDNAAFLQQVRQTVPGA